MLLRDSGLLEHILPELAATIGCEQSPDFHPEGSVFNHICLMLEKLPLDSNELLPWTVLLHDIAKPVTAERDSQTGSIHFYGHEKVGAEMARTILNRLRFQKKQIDEIVACVLHHMQFKDVKQMRKSTLRRLLLRDIFPLELELHKLDCLGSHGDLELYNFLVEQAEELKKETGNPSPAAYGQGFDSTWNETGKRSGRVAARNPREAIAGRTENAARRACMGKKANQETNHQGTKKLRALIPTLSL